MNDQEFRDLYHPLIIPAHFNADAGLDEQTLFALAQIGDGSIDEVVAKLNELHNFHNSQDFIAAVHELLTGWYEKGLLSAANDEGTLRFSLQKITKSNDGHVDPELLAPGLD